MQGIGGIIHPPVQNATGSLKIDLDPYKRWFLHVAEQVT